MGLRDCEVDTVTNGALCVCVWRGVLASYVFYLQCVSDSYSFNLIWAKDVQCVPRGVFIKKRILIH